VEQFATLLLFGTPLLVLAKLVHGLATRRLSFAPRGARVELVAWLLIGTVDSHTAALWSSAANQPADLCSRYRPALGENVHISSGDFFDYPVDARCVWPGRESVSITPWPLNVLTAAFFAAAVAVTAYFAIRAYRRNTATSGEQR